MSRRCDFKLSVAAPVDDVDRWFDIDAVCSVVDAGGIAACGSMLGGGVLTVTGGAAGVGAGAGSDLVGGGVSLCVPLDFGATKGVGTAAFLSTGFDTSSKLDVSSEESSLSSLSANLEAMFEIEFWLSFIEGGGPRTAATGVGSAAAGAGAFAGGVAARGGSAFVASAGL